MPTRSTMSHTVLVALALSFTLAGCVPVAATPVESPAASAAPTEQCEGMSPSLRKEVAWLVAEEGSGATVTNGVTVFDEGSGFWHIGATLEVPGSTDGVIAVWATLSDVTTEPFAGEIWAASDTAERYSTAEVTLDANVLPERAPIMVCHRKMAATSPAEAPCLELTDSLLAEVNRVVVAKGNGATATEGAAVFDELSGYWHVSASIAQPGNTDAYLAVWVTSSDVTDEPFVGELLATQVGAADASISEPRRGGRDLDGARIGVCHHQITAANG